MSEADSSLPALPVLPDSFTALRCRSDGRTAAVGALESMTAAELSPGELLVRTRFAGVNYKDCLAITARARIIEAYPRIPGIELVGDVAASEVASFAPGTPVMAHGFRTGIAFDGGFSPWVRVPAAHAMAVPAGLDVREIAILGVPGFTVGLCLDRFEQLGVTPASGPVAVDGATGAVGMLAIAILARAGFEVVALTGKPSQESTLRALGASQVLETGPLLASRRALETERFAAAIDNVGGALLGWLLKSMRSGGALASVGNASGNDYPGNVLPFIMRSVQVFGVVANAPWPVRHRVWARLASEWRPDFECLEPHVRTIALDALPAHCGRQLAGATSGRTLVAF
ncbi:MAG TPA: YhdH/YhfP family quinone oxidoreductase [Caldimonas sp.]|nr:YhdH/YhfP family quinone oxidoreductase [Caldimonas sp.]